MKYTAKCLFLFYNTFSRHFFRLFDAHNIEQCGRYVTERFAFFQRASDVLIARNYKRHEICGVRRARRTALELHHFGIAVIGSDDRSAAALPYRLDNLFQTFVDRFDLPYRSWRS